MFAGAMNLVKMLKKMLQFSRRSNFRLDINDWDDDTAASLMPLPEDHVKEGHFVVHAIDDGKQMRRFVIELSYLADPGFMRLLEQAEEEFGFQQQGVLAVPCRHSDLEKILESRNKNKK
ncbi:unnamed protein product [Withania somnifera]